MIIRTDHSKDKLLHDTIRQGDLDPDDIDRRLAECFEPGPDEWPWSRWTKQLFLETIRVNRWLTTDELEKLGRMKWADAKPMFLVKAGVFLCGSATIAGAMRHTVYWKIDHRFLKEFLKDME